MNFQGHPGGFSLLRVVHIYTPPWQPTAAIVQMENGVYTFMIYYFLSSWEGMCLWEFTREFYEKQSVPLRLSHFYRGADNKSCV